MSRNPFTLHSLSSTSLPQESPERLLLGTLNTSQPAGLKDLVSLLNPLAPFWWRDSFALLCNRCPLCQFRHYPLPWNTLPLQYSPTEGSIHGTLVPHYLGTQRLIHWVGSIRNPDQSSSWSLLPLPQFLRREGSGSLQPPSFSLLWRAGIM